MSEIETEIPSWQNEIDRILKKAVDNGDLVAYTAYLQKPTNDKSVDLNILTSHFPPSIKGILSDIFERYITTDQGVMLLPLYALHAYFEGFIANYLNEDFAIDDDIDKQDLVQLNLELNKLATEFIDILNKHDILKLMFNAHAFNSESRNVLMDTVEEKAKETSDNQELKRIALVRKCKELYFHNTLVRQFILDYPKMCYQFYEKLNTENQRLEEFSNKLEKLKNKKINKNVKK